jgi:hypothetical protein
MGGNGAEQPEAELEVTEVEVVEVEVTTAQITTEQITTEQESFVERMERAARGVPGALPVDDPDQTGEDRFDAG